MMRKSLPVAVLAALVLVACANAERNKPPDASPPPDGAIDGPPGIDAPPVQVFDAAPRADAAETEFSCTDGIDNDLDGRTDCRDSNCDNIDGCEYMTEVTCSDSIDNDADGKTDCDDTNCQDGPPCTTQCPAGSTMTTVAATDSGVSIPDVGTVTSVAHVPAGQIVTAVMVGVDIIHPSVAELELKLEAPTGGWIWLSRKRGGSGADYYHTVFTDTATTPVTSGTAPFTGSFRPEQPLATFEGILAPGDWTLTVNDDVSYDEGFLSEYVIYVCSCACEFGAACIDGDDNDSDGATDCDDTECQTDPRCVPEANCVDFVDNDLDGLTDCDDPHCASGAVCGAEANCGDGTDNDSDTYTDCLDPGCDGTAGCEYPTERTCNDGIDNDDDGQADCNDADCTLSCAVGFCPAGTIPMEFSASDVPIPIVDVSTVTSTITVPNTNTVASVVVSFSANHTYDSELDVYLQSPAGTSVELTTDNGTSGDNYVNTIFSDTAATAITAGAAPFTGVFRPEQSLARVAGEPANGAWQLDVTDDSSGDVGTLNLFRVRLCLCDGACEVGALCADGLDNDGDAQVDCSDSDCAGTALCAPEANCVDGIDDDADGRADCLDPGCALEALCRPEASCTNGTDDDGDGRTDCQDPGCDGVGLCEFPAETQCGDGADNDGDSAADCFDPDCSTEPACMVGPCPPGFSPLDLTAADLPISVVDNATVNSVITVAQTSVLTAITVGIWIDHSYLSDLDLFLVAPSGTRVELSTDNGGSSDGYLNTYFRDNASIAINAGSPTAVAPFTGAYRPEQPLSALDGQSAAGQWKLEVSDDAGGDTGTINEFNLRLCLCDAASCEVGALCADGLDNDGDGLADCRDPNCSTVGACAPEVDCENRIDDDGDGFTDCDDPGCDLEPLCGTEASCNNGTDEDGDGYRDCMDPGCDGISGCEYGAEHTCNDALDNDGNGVSDCAEPACSLFCGPMTCAAGQRALGYLAIDTPKAIPDLGNVSSVIDVLGVGHIAKAAVELSATHLNVNDLSFSLISPGAADTIDLSSRNGGTGDNYTDTVFLDGAATAITAGAAPFTGQFSPEQPLSVLVGDTIEGAWTLRAGDAGATFTGMLTEYKLGLCVGP